ncbi:hypothetical protein MOP88_07080 [Sphingomonas sp. WKB10]|nr:hypothetical protein [Sphingomonas sp. WKB10]
MADRAVVASAAKTASISISFAEGDKSLADHLLAQAGAVIDGPDWFIAQHLIDQIDEAGYLTVPLLDIANRLGTALARVERVLRKSRRSTPPASARATSPSASRSRRRRRTATIPAWRG